MKKEIRPFANNSLTIRKPSLEDVLNPPYTAILECDEEFPEDSNGNPDPSVTGYPFVQTAFGIFDLDQDLCNLGTSYQDEPSVSTCGGGYAIRRTWTLVDWCNPADAVAYFQTIKVADFTPPEVECPIVDYNQDGVPDTLTFPTGPFDCTASFEVPLPTVSDNCSSWGITTEILTVFEGDTVVLAYFPPEVQNMFTSSIPLGCHWIRYTVVDECGNTTIETCPFCVIDMISPVAICNASLNLSLGGEGAARLYTEEVDESSWDNCGAISLQIRRLYETDPFDCSNITPFYSEWADYVDFSCCDIGQQITVELQVTDEADNTDVCWMEVLIEDKVKPTCIPPQDVEILCTELPYGLDVEDPAALQAEFGIPQTEDNCPGGTWEELDPILNLHDCGFGSIVRSFRAIDESGNISEGSCQQLIIINSTHNYEIRFPADGEADCGLPSPDTIISNAIACDLLAISVQDEQFAASGDECYKIFRTYRVINWCEYDGNADPVIISREEDCDGLAGDEAVWVLRRPSEAFIDRDEDETNNNPLTGTKGIACDGSTNPEGYWRSVESNGYWQYTQHIKVYDSVDPEIIALASDPFCSLDDDNCEGEIELSFSIDENCTPDDLNISIFYNESGDGINYENLTDAGVLSGTYPNYVIGGTYPIGSHMFSGSG